MVLIRGFCAICLVITAFHYALGCEEIESVDYGDGEADEEMLRLKPQTVSNFFKYSEIADDTRSKLTKVIETHQLDCQLFEDHIEQAGVLFFDLFEEVADALVGMIYSYEKRSIVEDCLELIIDSELADEFVEELGKYECYKNLLGITPRADSDPSPDADANVKIGVRCHTSSDEDI
jgi:hypothetical protein